MATRQLVRNATVFDSAAGRLRPGSQIVIEGERSSPSAQEPLQVDDAAQTIDAGGRVVLPGLIDAHVHVVAASHDLSGLALQPPSLVTAHSSRILRDMLQRGFTTVRDAAGADFGLQEAVARGLFEGPRLFIAGFPITRPAAMPTCGPRACASASSSAACAGLGLIGAIADGVGEVRRAARAGAHARTRSRSWPAAPSRARPTRWRARSSRGRTARRGRGGRGRQPVRDGPCVLAARRARAVQAGVRWIDTAT